MAGAGKSEARMTRPDPFVHHPELTGLIDDPETSFFRCFEPSDFDAQMDENGLGKDWRYSREEREACRVATLADRPGGDFWVFGYASLMWDPAIRFEEVRRARVDGYHRRFCLLETLGGRGTREVPGLMAGLDTGDACDGLVFRIAEDGIDAETEILWRRERIRPGYRPAFVEARTDLGSVHALTFVADPEVPDVVLDLPHERQVEMIATAGGFLGTSLGYVENLAEHFTAMRIEDDDLFALLEDARAYAARLSMG